MVDHASNRHKVYQMVMEEISKEWTPLQHPKRLGVLVTCQCNVPPPYTLMRALRDYYPHWCIRPQAEYGDRFPYKLVYTLPFSNADRMMAFYSDLVMKHDIEVVMMAAEPKLCGLQSQTTPLIAEPPDPGYCRIVLKDLNDL